MALVAAWGVREGMRAAPAGGVRLARGLPALWAGQVGAALPVVVLVAIFSGYATPVEAAALAAVYALVVQCFVHRDIDWPATLPAGGDASAWCWSAAC